MKKQTFLNALCGATFGVLALVAPAGAQPGSGGPGPAPVPVPDPVPNGPTEVPLDGGASLLLASGVAYGLRRLHARRAKA